MKILATRPLPSSALERLRREAVVESYPEDETMPYEALLSAVAPCDGLICVLTDRIDAAVLAAAPRLKVVSTVAAGTDNIDLRAAAARKIVVTNTPDALTETTADLTWALLLATARRVVEADQALRRGEFRAWQLMGHLGFDVHGKTLGIVGLGRIGRAVARRARGFGMRVLYHNRSRVPDEVEAELGAEWVTLETLLESSHVVSLHTPLTKATHHMIDENALARMRSDAILINVGRGPVVDEAALVTALRGQRIAGAGLDVYEREPELSAGLIELSNTVLLPHIGSASHETRGRMADQAVNDCLAVLAGRAPTHPVKLS